MEVNLIRNGSGLLGDNTNFSNWIFDDTEVYDGCPSFKYTGSRREIIFGPRISIDVFKAYTFSLNLKAVGDEKIYLGRDEYDQDGLIIQPFHSYSFRDTTTKLAKDLKNGDTVVYFEDLSAWHKTTATHQLGLIFWNYKDSKRNAWADLYTFDNVDKTNNTITLKSAWNHGTFEAGTSVSQTNSSGHKYFKYLNSTLPTEWANTYFDMKGIQPLYGYEAGSFNSAAKYMSFIILHNWSNNSADITTCINNIKLIEKNESGGGTDMFKDIFDKTWNSGYLDDSGSVINNSNYPNAVYTNPIKVNVGDAYRYGFAIANNPEDSNILMHHNDVVECIDPDIGRNLLPNTMKMDGGWVNSISANNTYEYDTENDIYYRRVWSSTQSSWVNYLSYYKQIQPSTVYTCSFLAKKASGNVNPTLMCRFDRDEAIFYVIPASGLKVTDEWQRYSFTFTSSKSSGYEPLRFYAFYNTGAYGYDTAILIAQVKLEKGNTASDYSIAYEDMTDADGTLSAFFNATEDCTIQIMYPDGLDNEEQQKFYVQEEHIMAIKASNQITIVDVTDAYSVMLTSEAYTFVGGTSGAASGQSCSTEAVAFQGNNQCGSVNVSKDDIVCPTGITATVENNGSSKVKITFTTSATISSACEATIPVVVDGITVNKKFSFAVAKTGATGATGATGVGVKSITNYFLATSASTGVTTSTSGWSTTMQATTTTNKYLWSYQLITYTNNTTAKTVPAIIGTHGATGATGAQGVSISKVTNKYLTTSAASGVTTSTTGWADTPTATTTTNKYIWCYQIITYSNNTTTTTVPAIIGTHGATGATGATGAPAIAMAISASNGTVFKNNSGSTVLTAHVYVGGVEQSITDAGVCGSYGSVKWYKDGSATALATSKTLTVSAADVTNTQGYSCQLEK